MKTYKVLKTYLPAGKAGDQIELQEDCKFTNDLLTAEIIAELKITAPTETKKTRAKKAK